LIKRDRDHSIGLRSIFFFTIPLIFLDLLFLSDRDRDLIGSASHRGSVVFSLICIPVAHNEPLLNCLQPSSWDIYGLSSLIINICLCHFSEPLNTKLIYQLDPFRVISWIACARLTYEIVQKKIRNSIR